MNSEYTLKIDFQKNSEKPERVFKSMADLIQSFRNIDIALARSVCTDIEPILLLQEIETGSIRTRLVSMLKAIDDSAIKELNWKKIVGSFLVKGKYRLVQYLENKKTINSLKQIEEIQKELIELAKDTNVLHIPSYSPIPAWKLLIDIQQICDSISPLLPDDKALFISDLKPLLINPQFKISQESIENLLTDRVFSSDKEMILKVKKPDFLGQSMWDMKDGVKAISAKITDQKWLTAFQEQKVSVLPGDSLHGLVRHQENVDQQGQLVSESYQILEVWNVIKRSKREQLPLLPLEREK